MKDFLFVKFRLWGLVVFCFLSVMAALGVAVAQESGQNSRDFWVKEPTQPPGIFRKAKTTLRASGTRSLIYVENELAGGPISEAFLQRLQRHLEVRMPAGAISSSLGMVSYLESVFGPLPRKIHADERLIVLFANLGHNQVKPIDAAYRHFDQLSDIEARARYRQRSNEANIIYVNGFQKSESYITGIIARELQRLLADTGSGTKQEAWLAATLAEGATLLSGSFEGQNQVNELAKSSGTYPLVSHARGSRAAQLLFSSFLLDSLSANSSRGLADISKAPEPGKSAVERVFREQTGAPLTFDSIFSSFVSYVFSHSGNRGLMPGAWQHDSGISMPDITPYFTFAASSGELTGQLAPYSFLAIDLAQELSSTVVIETERISGNGRERWHAAESCEKDASVLWKPIAPTRIAIYSIGCDPALSRESVSFRLKILDQPSFLPQSSLTILPR